MSQSNVQKFNARFFNNVEINNENTVIKKSKNKYKIKQEYMYYQLLPEHMKKWMIEPYDYEETQETSQYKMKRLYINDISVDWTNGNIKENEFINILEKVFYYINERERKDVTKKKYEEIENELFINKVEKRIEKLKQIEFYKKLDIYIKNGTDFSSIDEIYEFYKKIYNEFFKINKKYFSVIGHGDLCFSNMFYIKQTDDIKFIDPKGALSENELWTNPYYDIAKLSHSICGNYDFFNYNRYKIYLCTNFKYKLEFYNDNAKYVDLFRKYLEKNEFNYYLVRLYEASLFLSMLPLHIDCPHKVFGFLLNAINILKEIEK